MNVQDKLREIKEQLDERCERCGLTWGAHLNSLPYSCPAHQGHMDYVEGTAFKPSGIFEKVEYGTPADPNWLVEGEWCERCGEITLPEDLERRDGELCCPDCLIDMEGE